jgi:hypothetical protein
MRKQILERQLKGPGATFHNLIALTLGLGTFAVALYVDYHIVNEFWIRALANEYMDNINPALLASATAKSLQVLFATLAIHYLLSHIGNTGRTVYVVFVSLMAAFMVLALGGLWAKGTGIVQDPNGILCKLQGGTNCSAGILGGNDEFIALVALSSLFLIVASVGAIGLHSAMRGFIAMTGGTIMDHHDDAIHGNRVRNELVSVKASLSELGDSDDDVSLQLKKLPEFVSSYSTGVLDRRFFSGKTNKLLSSVTKAADEVRSKLVQGTA